MDLCIEGIGKSGFDLMSWCSFGNVLEGENSIVKAEAVPA